MYRYPFQLRRVLLIFLTVLTVGGLASTAVFRQAEAESATANLPPIVFVARQHLATPDRIFKDEVGPAGQFGTGIPKYAPGSRLVLRQPDGTLTLFNTPGLVDVQSPDVNFDATKIVFAGAKSINPDSPNYGWRLYEINVDGTGFRQLTFSDRNITIPNADEYQNEETYGDYHDLFPAYLADGRIVFNSSRYPIRAHYDQRETFNVYIMDANGQNIRRLTTERASVLHPTPLPDGRLLVSRWWNQFNQPSDQGIYNRQDNANVNTMMPDGTVILANPDSDFDPAEAILPEGFPVRKGPNTWHLMVMNSDGTDFQRLAWTPRYSWNLTNDSGKGDNFAAAQPAVILPNGNPASYLIAYTSQQDQTMVHSTKLTGIRIARPGVENLYANATPVIAGHSYDDNSEQGPYALHPWGLPDGRILYAQSVEQGGLPTSGSYTDSGETFDLQGSDLRYQLHVMNVDGSGKAVVSTNLAAVGLPHADAMDAKPISPRVGWGAQTDQFTAVTSDDPLDVNIPNSFVQYIYSRQDSLNDIETATIHNPNVYANPSLNTPFVNNSPPPGSVAFAEIWVDANQFSGARCWGLPECDTTFVRDTEARAVLFDTVPVVDGAFTAEVPADVMSFIILRDENGRLVRNWNRGYASIAQGSAWARPGETVTCVGCHMGHVSGSLDDVMSQSIDGWTNVAPYATATASSQHRPQQDTFSPEKLIDRRGWVPLPAGGVPAPLLIDDPNADGYQDDETGWLSDKSAGTGSWVNLRWPSSMRVKQVRLIGPPPVGGDWGGFGDPEQFGPYYVESATIRFYENGTLVRQETVGRIEPLAEGGTAVTFTSPIVFDQMRVSIDAISGRYYWSEVAAMNEIEVIGQAAEPWPTLEIYSTYMPSVER